MQVNAWWAFKIEKFKSATGTDEYIWLVPYNVYKKLASNYWAFYQYQWLCFMEYKGHVHGPINLLICFVNKFLFKVHNKFPPNI